MRRNRLSQVLPPLFASKLAHSEGFVNRWPQTWNGWRKLRDEEAGGRFRSPREFQSAGTARSCAHSRSFSIFSRMVTESG